MCVCGGGGGGEGEYYCFCPSSIRPACYGSLYLPSTYNEKTKWKLEVTAVSLQIFWQNFYRNVCWVILYLTYLFSSPEPKADKVSLYYSKALSSVVHTFEQLYLQDQLANFSQILSVAPLGWGKGCFRFWAKTVVTMATETPIDI